MRADAELALRTLARGSRFRPHALLLLGVSQLLAGEVDQADDLFADAVEEGLELGAHEAAAVALGERAAIAIGREALGRGRGARRPSASGHPPFADGGVPDQRVRLCGGGPRRAPPRRSRSAPTSSSPGRSACGRGSPTRCRTSPSRRRLELARAYLALADAGGAETMLREIDALLRRQPDLGTLRAEVEELRASLKTMRADAPGASTLTEAELRLLPYLATHLSFREIGERLYLSRHTVKSHAMAIYRKLNVTSRNGAVERARELGLL